MKTSVILWGLALVCALLVFFTADGLAFNIPLVIEDNSGVDRTGWPARGGVPFPPGMLFPREVASLSVVDQNGRAIPAQFEPFVLWWGRDGSVKWLLVDLFVAVPANGKSQYRLVRKEPSFKSRVQLEENEKSIVVVTGPLKAVVSKKRGTILEEVFVDADQDKSFSPGERIIRPDRLNGSLVESDVQEIVYGESNEYNMWGHGGGRITRESYIPGGQLKDYLYASGYGAPEKTVVEACGPVRATIRIEGRHVPQKKGEGIRAEGFYYYTVRVHFFSGKSYVHIQHSLDNERKDYPMHIYRIREARLQFALEDRGNAYFEFGTQDGKPYRGAFRKKTVSLLQDSANRERWDLYNKMQGKEGEELKAVPGYFFRAGYVLGPSAFRGYKIVEGLTWPANGQVLEQGDQSPGWGCISWDNKRLYAAVQRFWMESPKAIRIASDRLELVFFPDFSPENFQIHSSARKSHKCTLVFRGDKPSQDDQAVQVNAFLYPLVVRSVSEWYAESGAYPRHFGTASVDDRDDEHWYPHFRWDRSIITANWKTLGAQESFNEGGMHANYWSLFHEFLRDGGMKHWEQGKVFAKWASEWIPWLLHDYSFSPDDPVAQHHIIGWGPKKLYVHKEATQVRGWRSPFSTNIPAFTSPAKFHLDGEHLIHMWPFEWYYLTGSPIAREGLMAIGNQAKYSTHRNFFKCSQGYRGALNPAPSLNQVFYYDDAKHPERVPWYFYTRIYAAHLISTAWTYAATGDDPSLFYARWLVRRILYLQRTNGGTVGGQKRWDNIPPWQEAETAIAAYALYRETGDEELLDIMGSWLEWAWHEAYQPGKGMPHRFKRGTKPDTFEHHWYPAVAAPLCYVALGDSRALEITEEWSRAALPHIKKGEFLSHAAGQSAAYALTHVEGQKKDKEAPETITDLQAAFVPEKGVVLSWTAPKDKSLLKRYWVKYSDKPIVNHPSFPEDLGKENGFYHADNVKDEPIPASSGFSEKCVIQEFAPHGTYGTQKSFDVNGLDPGTYYFAMKCWDEYGNLSSMSNVASVTIDRPLMERLKRNMSEAVEME